MIAAKCLRCSAASSIVITAAIIANNGRVACRRLICVAASISRVEAKSNRHRRYQQAAGRRLLLASAPQSALIKQRQANSTSIIKPSRRRKNVVRGHYKREMGRAKMGATAGMAGVPAVRLRPREPAAVAVMSRYKYRRQLARKLNGRQSWRSGLDILKPKMHRRAICVRSAVSSMAPGIKLGQTRGSGGQ